MSSCRPSASSASQCCLQRWIVDRGTTGSSLLGRLLQRSAGRRPRCLAPYHELQNVMRRYRRDKTESEMHRRREIQLRQLKPLSPRKSNLRSRHVREWCQGARCLRLPCYPSLLRLHAQHMQSQSVRASVRPGETLQRGRLRSSSNCSSSDISVLRQVGALLYVSCRACNVEHWACHQLCASARSKDSRTSGALYGNKTHHGPHGLLQRRRDIRGVSCTSWASWLGLDTSASYAPHARQCWPASKHDTTT
jgi:hypothetical protein